MFKNMFTTKLASTSQKKFEDSRFQQFQPSKSQKIRDQKSLGRGIFQVHQIGKMVRTHEVSGPKAAIFWGVGSPAIPQRPLINLAVDWSEKTQRPYFDM